MTVLITGRASATRVAARAHVIRSIRGKLERLSGWLGAFDADVGAGKPDRSRALHALQRLHQSLSRARDRLELPDRSRSLPRPSAVRRRLRRDRRDRLRRARDSRAQRALRSRARPRHATPYFRMHQPPQGYWRPGAIVAAQARPSTEIARRGRRVREAEILRLQGFDLRALALAASRAATCASTSARPRRFAPTAITSSSSRICAWAAAPAPPSAHRAR